MLRIIHTADVHLGARHDDLGEQATAQRERQFGAFKAAVDLALTERVDLFLVAGDLFDSNVQPRRSVEGVRLPTLTPPGTTELEYLGRTEDSLLFHVVGGVFPDGIIPPPSRTRSHTGMNGYCLMEPRAA